MKFILGLCGITGISLSPVYWAGERGYLLPVAFVLGIVCFAFLALSWLGFLGYRSEQQLAEQAAQLPCDFPALERLCQLVPQLREDAVDYSRHRPDMMDRLRELQSHSAIFTAAGLTNEFQWFLNYIGDAITRKQTHLSSSDRDEVRSRIDEAYPLLKAVLDKDYSRRRATRT